jgi:predicted aspartyl protease
MQTAQKQGWRRRVSSALCALCALCLLLGFHVAEAQRNTRFLTEYRLDREIVEIPFEYIRRNIVMKVQINEQKDLTFLLDTGATALVLDTRLGIRGLHIEETQFREAEGITKAEAVSIENIQIASEKGTVNVHNAYALLTPLNTLSQRFGRRIDGVLGMSVLAGFVLEIDYAKKFVRFYNTRLYSIATRKPDNQKTFLLDLKPVNPKATISCLLVSGKLHPKYDYDFLLDTGFSGYVGVAHTAAQEAGHFGENTPRIPITSYGVNRSFQSYRLKAPFLSLGEINLTGRTIQVDVRNKEQYGQFGLLGNRLLQNYRLTLDTQRRKMWLERVTEAEEADEPEGLALGLLVKHDGRVYKVAQVLPNSPAQRAGIRVGDLIVAVNGKLTYEMTAARVLGLINDPKGRLTLELADGRDVTLEPPMTQEQ